MTCSELSLLLNIENGRFIIVASLMPETLLGEIESFRENSRINFALTQKLVR